MRSTDTAIADDVAPLKARITNGRPADLYTASGTQPAHCLTSWRASTSWQHGPVLGFVVIDKWISFRVCVDVLLSSDPYYYWLEAGQPSLA
jgi:hypothetical protein